MTPLIFSQIWPEGGGSYAPNFPDAQLGSRGQMSYQVCCDNLLLLVSCENEECICIKLYSYTINTGNDKELTHFLAYAQIILGDKTTSNRRFYEQKSPRSSAFFHFL